MIIFMISQIICDNLELDINYHISYYGKSVHGNCARYGHLLNFHSMVLLMQGLLHPFLEQGIEPGPLPV